MNARASAASMILYLGLAPLDACNPCTLWKRDASGVSLGRWHQPVVGDGRPVGCSLDTIGEHRPSRVAECALQ